MLRLLFLIVSFMVFQESRDLKIDKLVIRAYRTDFVSRNAIDCNQLFDTLDNGIITFEISHDSTINLILEDLNNYKKSNFPYIVDSRFMIEMYKKDVLIKRICGGSALSICINGSEYYTAKNSILIYIIKDLIAIQTTK